MSFDILSEEYGKKAEDFPVVVSAFCCVVGVGELSFDHSNHLLETHSDLVIQNLYS
jgi:hypothetical protein